MVYTGHNGYVYWGVEDTELGGEPSTDQHIPFNPLKTFKPPKPVYAETEEVTFDQLVPKYIYTNDLPPATATNSHVFKDPFMLLAFFTHKATSGSWGTGDGTITADFTDTDDVDTMFIQYHIPDQSGSGNNINRLIKGVLPSTYTLRMEHGMALMEEVELVGRNFSDNTQAMSCANTFHDQAWGSAVGGWADWDDDGVRYTKDVSIHWNDVVIDGVDIKSAVLQLNVGWATDYKKSELYHSVKNRSLQDFTLTLNGALADKGELEESEKLYTNKTTNTLKIYYDTETSYTKYIQITNGYVQSHDVVSIPAAGEKAEVSITFKGGEDCAASFSGTWEDHADPSSLVTTS